MITMTATFTPHIGMTLVFLILAIMLYVQERLPIELTSLGLLAAMLVGYHLFPIPDPLTGENRLNAEVLIRGFANPALLTVIALLVVGEGITRTGCA